MPLKLLVLLLKIVLKRVKSEVRVETPAGQPRTFSRFAGESPVLPECDFLRRVESQSQIPLCAVYTGTSEKSLREWVFGALTELEIASHVDQLASVRKKVLPGSEPGEGGRHPEKTRWTPGGGPEDLVCVRAERVPERCVKMFVCIYVEEMRVDERIDVGVFHPGIQIRDPEGICQVQACLPGRFCGEISRGEFLQVVEE